VLIFKNQFTMQLRFISLYNRAFYLEVHPKHNPTYKPTVNPTDGHLIPTEVQNTENSVWYSENPNEKGIELIDGDFIEYNQDSSVMYLKESKGTVAVKLLPAATVEAILGFTRARLNDPDWGNVWYDEDIDIIKLGAHDFIYDWDLHKLYLDEKITPIKTIDVYGEKSPFGIEFYGVRNELLSPPAVITKDHLVELEDFIEGSRSVKINYYNKSTAGG
jgi:hypothetical protein